MPQLREKEADLQNRRERITRDELARVPIEMRGNGWSPRQIILRVSLPGGWSNGGLGTDAGSGGATRGMSAGGGRATRDAGSSDGRAGRPTPRLALANRLRPPCAPSESALQKAAQWKCLRIVIVARCAIRARDAGKAVNGLAGFLRRRYGAGGSERHFTLAGTGSRIRSTLVPTAGMFAVNASKAKSTCSFDDRIGRSSRAASKLATQITSPSFAR